MQTPQEIRTDAQSVDSAYALLSVHPDFRVLRKLDSQSLFGARRKDVGNVGKACILDTETTGKDSAKDRVIELGFVTFEYDRETGDFLRAVDKFDELADPGIPIPPEATKVNGITDEMVKGCQIDVPKVESLLADVDLVIAHNSEFDRKIVEAAFGELFVNKAWGCSRRQVDWAAQGIGSAKLDYIAFQNGFFYDAHRAVNDCLATLHMLTLPREDGRTSLQELLENAGKKTFHIWAVESPFHAKDLLKVRGYRWSPGTDPNSPIKAWHKVVDEDKLVEEQDWLLHEVYGPRNRNQPLVQPIDALTRFSSREG